MPEIFRPMPGTRSDFHYNELSDRRKRMYERIRRALVNSEESVTFAESMTVESAMELIESVLNDNPQIFWIKNGCQITVGSGNTTLKFIQNRFAKDREKYKAGLIKVANDIFEKYVGNKKDAYDIELAVHDLIASSVKYDGTDDDSAHSIVGPLLFRRGVCEGIAKSVAFLLNAYGVDTAVIFGEKKTGGEYHAWNIMRIGKDRYLSDITLDIQNIQGPPIRFYLNMDEKMASRTHIMKKSTGCASKKYNYYSLMGTYFRRLEEADKHIMGVPIETISASGTKKLKPVTYEFYVEETSDLEHFIGLLREKYSQTGIGFVMNTVCGEGRYRISVA